MKTIRNFRLEVTGHTLHMPRNSELLDIQMQDGSVQLWALVDPEAAAVDRRVEGHRLRITGYQKLRIQRGAELVGVLVHDGSVQLWALADLDADSVDRQVEIYATDQPVDAPGPYVGTVQVGSRVFHVFDRGEMEP